MASLKKTLNTKIKRLETEISAENLSKAWMILKGYKIPQTVERTLIEVDETGSVENTWLYKKALEQDKDKAGSFADRLKKYEDPLNELITKHNQRYYGSNPILLLYAPFGFGTETEILGQKGFNVETSKYELPKIVDEQGTESRIAYLDEMLREWRGINPGVILCPLFPTISKEPLNIPEGVWIYQQLKNKGEHGKLLGMASVDISVPSVGDTTRMFRQYNVPYVVLDIKQPAPENLLKALRTI